MENQIKDFKYCPTKEEKLNNAILRDPFPVVKLVYQYKEKIDLTIEMINSALDQLPNHEGEVNRTSNLESKYYEYYKNNVGNIIEEKGFTSTTKSNNTSDVDMLINFGSGIGTPNKINTISVIKSKTGKDIKHLSEYPNKNEILFKSGTKFKINSIKEDNIHKTVAKNFTYSIVYLEEV